jgi:Domain of unknown function (DUF4375)
MRQPYWDFIEPFFDEINFYDGPVVFRETFDSVPPAVGLIYAVHWCDAEVCNGGFRQFFGNSTGVLAPEAVRGFQAIGQDGMANIVVSAMDLLGNIYPRVRGERQARLVANVLAELQKLDEKFYELKDVEAGGTQTAADRYAESARSG